jgi:hypothetical protein
MACYHPRCSPAATPPPTAADAAHRRVPRPPLRTVNEAGPKLPKLDDLMDQSSGCVLLRQGQMQIKG